MAFQASRAASSQLDNFRGSLLMVLAMAGFALEDMLIKQMAANLPLGQILTILGICGGLVFSLMAWSRGLPLLTRAMTHPMVLARNAAEIFGTVFFLTAIATSPVSTASAILQASPILITLGAAAFLGEQVGWRRWSAVLFGLCGVMLVLRPGAQGVEAGSFLAVLGVIGFTIRDLVTRRVPLSTSSFVLAAYGLWLLVPTGLVMLMVAGAKPVALDPVDMMRMLAAAVIGVGAYFAVVMASRAGDLSVVTALRYSRIVFALMVGYFVFGERPDALMLSGAAMIVASGLYVLLREARLRRPSPSSPAAL